MEQTMARRTCFGTFERAFQSTLTIGTTTCSIPSALEEEKTGGANCFTTCTWAWLQGWSHVASWIFCSHHDEISSAHYARGRIGHRPCPCKFQYYVCMYRYNAERLSNGLSRVQTIPLQVGVPLDGYNAHLQDDNSGFSWTDRKPNTPFSVSTILVKISSVFLKRPKRYCPNLLQDIYHQNDPNLNTNVLINSNILTARDRLFQAIDSGFITDVSAGRS